MIEPGQFKGYVLDIGSTFFLLEVVADDIAYDGFQAMRLDDVSDLDVPHEHAAFVERAIELRGLRRAKRPSVDVESIETLLRSAAAAFPLLTIHREIADPDVCHIGQITSLAAGQVHLREISPDATWDREESVYRVDEVTRVDFGGRYEQALLLVGGLFE